MNQTTREIVLDTETTGLNPEGGDRIIEIACVELINHIPSGNNIQLYFNPETKNVSEEAEKIHGIKNNFLKKQKFFRDKADEIIEFISNDTLVIHNASFDIGFINQELKLCNKKKLKNPVIDTIKLARKKLGGGAVNLDALCRRFNIDISGRKLHGAFLDSHLLAEVYIELLGGRQVGLEFINNKKQSPTDNKSKSLKKYKKIILVKVSEEEAQLHKKFMKNFKNPVWGKYVY